MHIEFDEFDREFFLDVCISLEELRNLENYMLVTNSTEILNVPINVGIKLNVD